MGYTSTVFTGLRIENNRYITQSTLVIEYNRERQMKPEATYIRARLDVLILDTYTNQNLNNNFFKECVRRLKELNGGYTKAYASVSSSNKLIIQTMKA